MPLNTGLAERGAEEGEQGRSPSAGWAGEALTRAGNQGSALSGCISSTARNGKPRDFAPTQGAIGACAP